MLSPENAQTVGAIIDQEIDKAFDEGYKQGTINWEPQVEYWKLKDGKEKNLGWSDGFWYGFASGSFVTLAVTIGAEILLTRISK